MGSRYISAVALYGAKDRPVAEFLATVQALIAGQIGDSFRPYSLDQIHATLIMLTGVPDPATGAIVNEVQLERAGLGLEMDLPKAMRILTERLAHPLRVRIGGCAPRQPVPFLSQGQHLHERALSVQGNAFVLVGWPVAALSGGERPLNRLRRDMNAANVHHKYHAHDEDVDDDFHLVVGHHTGAPAEALERAVDAARTHVADHPIDLEISVADVTVVAADSHTLAPARFTGSIPVDETILRELMA